MRTFLLIATTLTSLNAYTYRYVCQAAEFPLVHYQITKKSVDPVTYIEKATLEVIEKTEVPNTCRSRWGCEYDEKTILRRLLTVDDVQGAAVFKGRGVEIMIEDIEAVSYTRTYKDQNGETQSEFRELICAQTI